jgi:putative transcriptional regulator
MMIGNALETPILLAAMPQVQDPFFHESVVLLVHHDDEGSFGLIVNRPTELKIADILNGMKLRWEGSAESLAYFGGPVRPQQGTILYQEQEAGELEIEGASQIFPGIQTTQHFSDLALLAEKPPRGLRLVLGYAGWGEQQLVQEIVRNDWITAPIRTELVFSERPERVWSETLISVGLDPSSLPSWTQPNDGEAN